VREACEACFEEHAHDTSAFVRAVASRLGMQLLGLANEIVDTIRGGNGWTPLQNGVAAANSAADGKFVIGGLKGWEQTEPSAHGHLVVVVAGPLAHGAYPSAYWGRLGGGGAKDKTINWAWGAGDRDRVSYAEHELVGGSRASSEESATTDASPARSPRPSSGLTYIVKKGDTLSDISLHFYGDATTATWRRIYETNRTILGPDPNLIIPGQALRIPPPKYPNFQQDPRLIRVLYATNRAIDGHVIGESNARKITHKRADELSYGYAVVRIPEFHKIGRVERPADLTIFSFTIWRSREKENKYFVLRKIEGFDRQRFVNELKQQKHKGAMVFVHGFNTTFIDAVFKTAQIAYDTNFAGVPVTFAWPSRGRARSYDYDRDSALFSRDAFLDVLRMIHDDASISKIYVIAHSMGNQIVIDALAHAEQAGQGIISLSELILAAPDVDSDVFRSMVNRLKIATHGLTLYASSADKAMLASRIKAGGVPRAGDIPTTGPLIVEGMDTIDVTAIGNELFGLNHSEYSSNRSLIDDIGRLILTGTRPPNVRSPQLRSVPEGASIPRYWRYAQ
jgi:esterase/lipase superfamily enzyme